MTYETYWEQSCYLVKSYEDAFELNKSMKNQELYLQGLYNYEAFQSVIGMFSWGMGGKKGEKPKPYRDSPHAITKHEIEAEKQRSIEKTNKWVEQGQK